eukprot:CAMPEP_0169070740 /NCGR_PEP_ID=MMETSP1015-20121227/5279_1 /TAXON_ID=342587 /ORGANISM="Karlodinium micrum, Strain CCMP2283" /LENGTH=101 /DNA_ID=CAMNT_0009129763 /DNA_START=670 /DNA_END=975 /DNA_ORIENTATION=-
MAENNLHHSLSYLIRAEFLAPSSSKRHCGGPNIGFSSKGAVPNKHKGTTNIAISTSPKTNEPEMRSRFHALRTSALDKPSCTSLRKQPKVAIIHGQLMKQK